MRRKKLTALLLCAGMLLSLVGCSQKGEPEAAGSGSDVEITYMHRANGTEKYVGEDSINNNVYTRYYKDELGITLNYTIAAAGDDYNQKLTMAIASNDLPDMMDLPPEEFQELARAGMLCDVTEYYDKYASDLLKAALESDGGTQLQSAMVDGKLYGIPQVSAADGSCDLLWIRTDWLERLSLEAPTTMEEMLEVARAFKNNDPDGNGVNDTWGIGFQQKIVSKDIQSPGSFEGFMAAYGAYTRGWVKGADGSIEYGGIREGAKEALIQLNQMYEEGLIDPEFGVKDTVKLGEDVAAGKVGMFYGVEGIPWGCAKSAIENNPDADWQCYPIVSATDQAARPLITVRIDRYYAVNAKCKNPEALFQIANVFQEKINAIDSSEETLNTFGVDPATGINFAEYAAFAMDPAIQKCNTYYKEIKGVIDGELKVEEIHPEAVRYYKVIKEFMDSGYDKKTNSLGWNYNKFIGPEGSWNTIINDYKANDLLEESLFFGAPTKTMSTNLASLDKLQSETYVNIIMGTQSPDSFDTFVGQWKELGGDQITKEVNEWYTQTFGAK